MSKVYIEIEGGNVVGVHSRNKNIEVVICDYDNAKAGDEYANANCKYIEKHRDKMYDVM